MTNQEPKKKDSLADVPSEKHTIVVCPDGPLLVRGDFDIVSTSGEKVTRRRKTVALCRCGASAIKPYCDGSHKLIGFSTETEGAPKGSRHAPEA